LDIGVLDYIGIVWPKEHSPKVWSVPPVTACIHNRCTKYRRSKLLLNTVYTHTKHLQDSTRIWVSRWSLVDC